VFTATLQPKWTIPDKQKSDGNLQLKNTILLIARLILNLLKNIVMSEIWALPGRRGGGLIRLMKSNTCTGKS